MATDGGTSGFPPAGNVSTAELYLGEGRSAITVPTSGPNISYGTQTAGVEGSICPSYTRLATPTVASSGNTPGGQGLEDAAVGGSSVGGTTEHQPTVASASLGGESSRIGTRACQRTLVSASSARVQ